MTLLAVAVGGALGALLRHGIDVALPVGVLAFPWPTLGVNVTGSAALAALGVVPDLRRRPALDGPAAALLGVGFCGGLTTYSSFAVQTLTLGWRRGTLYAVLTVAGGIAACAVGWSAGR